MKRLVVLVLALMAGLFAASCSTSSQMAEFWRDPDYKPQPVKKVMVVGIGENALRVRTFESTFSKHFSARKLEVALGSNLLPADSTSIGAFKNVVRGSGADLVTISRLVGMDTETAYVPGSTYVSGYGGYGYGYGGYYGASYSVVSSPGYTVQYKIYKVETMVYDIKTEKLIWNGISHTTDPVNFQDGVESMARTVVQSLVENKIIK